MAPIDRQRTRTRAGASCSKSKSAVTAACLCLAVLASAASASAVGGGEGQYGAELVQRQLASSADADGNTVVYSVDPAGATTTLETIEAGAVPVTTSAPPGVGGQDAERVTGTEASVNLGQQTAPSSTGSTRPPTTYIAYSTDAAGQQITLTQTFTPISILPSSSPQAPLVGTVLDISSYLPAPMGTDAATGSAGPNAKKFSRQNGKVAAVGVLLSVLAGALVVL